MSTAQITFASKGMKGCQGGVFSGLTVASSYQPQFHAPLAPEVAGLPNGRIVYVNPNGYLTTQSGVTAAKGFKMPLILQSGGAKVDAVPQTYRSAHSAPYSSAFPGPTPNMTTLPLCAGFEFFTTEYDEEATYTPNQPLSSHDGDPANRTAYPLEAAPGVPTAYDVGKVIPATATKNIIGFVALVPGTPRNYGDPGATLLGQPAAMNPRPNASIAVTGNNAPVLTFWGHVSN